MAENPYAPPSKDEAPPSPTAKGTIERPRPPMPGTVITVIVLVSIYLLVSLIGALRNPVLAVVQLGIAALILVGLVRRHALAWQWGMIIPVLAALGTFAQSAAVAGAGLGGPATLVLSILLALIVLQLAIPVLLTLHSSRIYFGLQCPECRSMKIKAGNFLFSAYTCRACKTTWRY
jgi:hypothetical protein